MQINYSQFWWSDVLILNSFNFSFQNVFFSFQDQIRKLRPFCSDFMFLLKRRTSWPVHLPTCLSSITRPKLQQIWRSRCRCENFLSHCNHFYDPTQITCLIKWLVVCDVYWSFLYRMGTCGDGSKLLLWCSPRSQGCSFFPSTQSKYIFRRSKSLQRLSARGIWRRMGSASPRGSSVLVAMEKAHVRYTRGDNAY